MVFFGLFPFLTALCALQIIQEFTNRDPAVMLNNIGCMHSQKILIADLLSFVHCMYLRGERGRQLNEGQIHTFCHRT